MNKLPVLLRRELQENRGSFIYLPLILSAFMLVLMLTGLTFSGTHAGGSFSVQMDKESRDVQGQAQDQTHEVIVVKPFSREAMQRVAAMDPDRRAALIHKVYVGLSAPLLLTLWIVAFVYAFQTLYSERKDRSILFWKSMPVSDAMTILSKLVSVAVVLPAIYLGCIVLVDAAALLVSSFSAWRQSVDVWNTLWVPSHLITLWLNFAGYLVLNSIWFLPVFSWLLLVSAWARSVPAAWALAVPIGLMIVERIFTPFHWVSEWIRQYSWPLGFHTKQMLEAGSFHLMLNAEMVVSLLIAAAMLYGAIYLRGRTDEI